jgi:hypothetical protein
MPKSKKCSKCSLPYHECAGTRGGWACKCIKSHCCRCPPSSENIKPETDKYSWECPCSSPACQSEWDMLKTKMSPDGNESDSDLEEEENPIHLFHCKCHEIAFVKAGSFCGRCNDWCCKKCIKPALLPDGVEDQSDSDNDAEEMCSNCLLIYYSAILPKIRSKQEGYTKAVEILQTHIQGMNSHHQSKKTSNLGKKNAPDTL